MLSYCEGSKAFLDLGNQGRRLATWVALEPPVSDQVAELGPVKGVVAVVVGLGMSFMLVVIARGSAIWVACLDLGRRIGKGAAPVVLGIGFVTQALWLGAFVREAVALVF
jgi:hypothetical protein